MRSEVSSGRRSAKVSTAWTPGSIRAAAASIALIRACATGLRRNATCKRARNIQVIDEAALAAQQRRVLDARHAAADQPGRSGVSVRGHCLHYDALRSAAPPPRSPSRIASVRCMEKSRVFWS